MLWKQKEVANSEKLLLTTLYICDHTNIEYLLLNSLLETLSNLWIWQWIQQTTTKNEKMRRRRKSWSLPGIKPRTSWFKGRYANHYTMNDNYVIFSKSYLWSVRDTNSQTKLFWPFGINLCMQDTFKELKIPMGIFFNPFSLFVRFIVKFNMILLKSFLATNLDTLCEYIYYCIDAYKPQVVNKNFMGSRWWFIAIFAQKSPKKLQK